MSIISELFSLKTLVFGIILAGVVDVLANFGSDFIKRKLSGPQDAPPANLTQTLSPSNYHWVQTFMTAVTAMHAVLAGISCAVVFTLQSQISFLASLPLVIFVGVVPFGILYLGRTSMAAALSQLLTFAGLFIWVLDSGRVEWTDMVPGYGVLAGASSMVIYFYSEAYNFLIAKTRL